MDTITANKKLEEIIEVIRSLKLESGMSSEHILTKITNGIEAPRPIPEWNMWSTWGTS